MFIVYITSKEYFGMEEVGRFLFLENAIEVAKAYDKQLNATYDEVYIRVVEEKIFWDNGGNYNNES